MEGVKALGASPGPSEAHCASCSYRSPLTHLFWDQWGLPRVGRGQSHLRHLAPLVPALSMQGAQAVKPRNERAGCGPQGWVQLASWPRGPWLFLGDPLLSSVGTLLTGLPRQSCSKGRR